jgi:hypothetical protein
MNLPIKTSAWMRPANFMRKAALVGALELAPLHGEAQTTAAQPPDIHNIILVHGAWADGSSWDKVIPLLEDKGFHVTAVHLPFTTLAEDAATVERALALQDGPVLLVGHYYGGSSVLSQALFNCWMPESDCLSMILGNARGRSLSLSSNSSWCICFTGPCRTRRKRSANNRTLRPGTS